MDIRKHLTRDLILVAPPAPDKTALLGTMLDAVVAHAATEGLPLDRPVLWQALMEREERQSTGLGHGFALPHARVRELGGLAVCLALLREPLEYGSADGQPVRIVCLVLTPEEQPTLALKVASKLTGLARNPAAAQALLAAPDAQAVETVLAGQDLAFEITITVADIMRRPLFEIRPETPLREVTFQLMRYRESATPVVDAEGNLAGEITCDRLFQFGLPDFFNQLKTVSFISQFDPFEKYFAREAQVTAREIMSPDYSALPEKATLLEAVFELTVKKHSRVYVTRGRRLVGLVDRATVLNQVINF